MDFDFSDDQAQLADAVGRWVDKAYTFERRRAITAAGGFDRAAYNELAELGLTALTVPEAHGGLGLGPVDSMVVMQALGQGLVLEPLAQTLAASTVLAHTAPDDVQAQWLRHREGHEHAEQVAAAARRLARECQTHSRAAVMGLSVHPWVWGMPSRITSLRRLLSDLQAVEGLRTSTADELYARCDEAAR